MVASDLGVSNGALKTDVRPVLRRQSDNGVGLDRVRNLMFRTVVQKLDFLSRCLENQSIVDRLNWRPEGC